MLPGSDAADAYSESSFNTSISQDNHGDATVACCSVHAIAALEFRCQLKCELGHTFALSSAVKS